MSGLALVTTSVNAGRTEVDRAERVAARCGVAYRPRRGLSADASAVWYVVGRDRDALVRGPERWSVHAGLLRARLAAGADHPLIRAVGPAARVADTTLGGAADALHVASALGCSVDGFEASPALGSLLEEGLPRLARAGIDAAERVSVHPGDARTGLAAVGPCDAVLVDPMFDTPIRAAPGFALVRAVAVADRFDAAWLAAALAVTPRVVVKVAAGSPAPVPGGTRIAGSAVDYLVYRA